MNNPILEGIKIKSGLDLFAKGFTDTELTDVYYGLSADSEDEALLVETATLEEIDAEYNPGIEMLLEAVTVRKFSQTPRRMAALVRALNKHFDGITADVAQIGKVKKSGLFASVTVQIPLSDGQVISIVFHSPDGDNRKIMPDDEIIAFRWILNKRDITQAVSPESGREVSLEQISKRITQIVAKNSEKFQKRQKQVGEQKGALRTARADLGIANAARDDLMMEFTAQREDDADIQMDLDNTQAQLDTAIARNADLQDQIDRWKQADAEKKAASESTEKAISDLLQNNTAEELGKQHSDIQEYMKSPGFGSLPESEQEVYRKDEYNLFTAKNQAKAMEDKTKAKGDKAELKALQKQASAFGMNSQNISSLSDQGIDALRRVVLRLQEEEKAEQALRKEAADLGMTDENIQANLDNGVDALRKVVRDQQLKQEADQQAEEIGRLQRLGTEKVPGIRLGDAEAAGRTWESYQKEELSKDDWDKYVADLYATGRASKPEPEEEPASVVMLRNMLKGDFNDDVQQMGEVLGRIEQSLSDDGLSDKYGELLQEAKAYYEKALEPKPTSEPEPNDPSAVQSLNNIINGDLDDDPDALDKALDMAAEELEEAGLMDQYDELLNEAADHYTVVLEQLKEAA